MDGWRSGADVGDVFQLDDEFDGRLASNCWAKGRLRTGDLIVAIAHKGDAFHNYILLNHVVVRKADGTDETKLMLEGVRAPFGSYRTGRHLFSLDRVTMAWVENGGDAISVPMPAGYIEPLREEPLSAGLRRTIEICSDELFDATSSPAEDVPFEIWQSGYDRAARVIRYRARKILGESPIDPEDET